MTSRTGALGALLVLCAVGCSDRDGKASFGPGSTGAQVGSSTAPGATPPSKLAIVAFHGELVAGAPPNSVVVLVNDPSISDARLLVDTGAGYVDSGAPPSKASGQPFSFTTSLSAQGTRYQVLAKKNQARVSSNEVTAGGHRLSAITITEPQGDYSGFPPLINAPPNARWDAVPGNPDYLVILRSGTAFEWIATTTTTTYKWGESFATTWFGGPTSLASGQHYLSVLALDPNGWATHGSERRAAANVVPFGFEIK